MKEKILLTVNREGEFTPIGSRLGIAQCGYVGKDDAYRYKVSITATNNKLLESFGFVIDNADIHDYFVDKYENKAAKCLSCELMACDAIDYFYNLFMNKDARCKDIELVAIEVTLYGSNHSHITARWVRSGGMLIA